MEPSAIASAADRALARHAKRIGEAREIRASDVARRSRTPSAAGMGFTHDVLIALIIAVVMALTVLLYR